MLWRCVDTVIKLCESITDVLQAGASAVRHSCSEAQLARLILERGNDLLLPAARSPGLDWVLLANRRDHKVHLAERIQRVVGITYNGAS